MKFITEQRRQKLISDCEEEITALKLRIEYGPWYLKAKQESELERQEIALASLTAEPKAYSDFEELAFAFDMANMWHDSFGHGEDIALYTTPPVPVIKLPDEFAEKTNSEYQLGKEEGWCDYEREIKRLNNLGD